jgi:anti-sigma28 factor (negative regulator of flagellin synthesis)
MQKPLPYANAVDTHRVSTIRDQLAEDAYVVNPQQIASKVIDLEIAFSKSSNSAMRATHRA